MVAPGGEVVDFGAKEVWAHVVDRVAYVASFAEKAQRAGARYLLGDRVVDVSIDGDHASVRLTDEMEGRTLRSRALVVASGFGSELTGQLGLGRVGDFATGVQAEVVAPGADEIHVYFGRGIAPGFFAWLVPTSGGRAPGGVAEPPQRAYPSGEAAAKAPGGWDGDGGGQGARPLGCAPQAPVQDLRGEAAGGRGRGWAGEAHHGRGAYTTPCWQARWPPRRCTAPSAATTCRRRH